MHQDQVRLVRDELVAQGQLQRLALPSGLLRMGRRARQAQQACPLGCTDHATHGRSRTRIDAGGRRLGPGIGNPPGQDRGAGRALRQSGEGMHGVSPEQELRWLRLPDSGLAPVHPHPRHLGGTQPAEHAQDHGRDVLVGRHELASATRLLRQLTQKTLGWRAADADCKDPVRRVPGLAQQVVHAPDVTIRDEQDVGGALGVRSLGLHGAAGPGRAQCECGQERRVHLGAAQVGVGTCHQVGHGTDGRCVTALQACKAMLHLRAETAVADLVGRAQGLEQLVQGAAGCTDAVTGHGP